MYALQLYVRVTNLEHFPGVQKKPSKSSLFPRNVALTFEIDALWKGVQFGAWIDV